MSIKHTKTESPVARLKNESARQRWELFHRAIAHAKASNDEALDRHSGSAGDGESPGPVLSVVR